MLLLHHINIKSAYFLVGAFVVYVGFGAMSGRVGLFLSLPLTLSSNVSLSLFFFRSILLAFQM
jgi:hypothetical protein